MAVFAAKHYLFLYVSFVLLVQSAFYILSQQNIMLLLPSTTRTTVETSLESPVRRIHHGPTIRASLAHWMGPMNLAAYEAWMVYHHQRWKVTDVDFHVHWELVDTVTDYFRQPQHSGGVRVRVYGHYVDKYTAPENYALAMIPLQFQVLQRTLANAKRDGNDFVMTIDADEFLDSNDFETMESLFADNETTAVTIPVYNLDYRLCSGTALNFASLGYQAVRPFWSNVTDDETKDFHTDAGIACHGNRKFIVRTDRWDHLGHIHDPVDCLRDQPIPGILDMSGRARDHQHLRFLHLRPLFGGIHADTSFRACAVIQNCTYFNLKDNTCVNSLAEADHYLVVPSAMQHILKGYPLLDHADELMRNATCYAQRYPELQTAFCPDLNPTTCQYTNLFQHYNNSTGEAKQFRRWGCSSESS